MLMLGKKPLKQKNNVNSFVTLKNPRIRSFVMSVFWFFIIASPLTPEKLHRNTLFEFFVKAQFTLRKSGGKVPGMKTTIHNVSVCNRRVRTILHWTILHVTLDRVTSVVQNFQFFYPEKVKRNFSIQVNFN